MILLLNMLLFAMMVANAPELLYMIPGVTMGTGSGQPGLECNTLPSLSIRPLLPKHPYSFGEHEVGFVHPFEVLEVYDSDFP